MAKTDEDLPQPAPGAKMMFLIRRRPGVSRDELVAHWFANHMPGVISAQEQSKAAGRAHAWRYLATLFDPGADGASPWDGVAQLWFDRPLPRPPAPFGEPPRDSFQQKAEPYVPWATAEYVMVDGADRLRVEPLTLNAPFPTTRAGFLKAVYLVAARPGTDYVELARHWLTVHVPNVKAALGAAGGFRYVASLSVDPANEPFADMAELYFPDAAAWDDFRQRLEPDGMEGLLDPNRTLLFTARTEMIGIP
jgi:hypothetical protein